MRVRIRMRRTCTRHHCKDRNPMLHAPKRHVIFATALLLTATTSLASPFRYYDARSQSMGGTGVASAETVVAAFYNPALLGDTRGSSNSFISFPNLTAYASDKSDFLDDLDDYQDLFDELEQLEPSLTARRQAIEAIETVQGALNELKEDRLEADVTFGFTGGITGRGQGVALLAKAWIIAGARANVEPTDEAVLRINLNLLRAGLPPIIPLEEDVDSTVDYRGAIIQEFGIAFGQHFETLWGISLGITPKIMVVNTFDYVQTVEEADLDFDEGRKDYSDFNVDIGIAKRFSPQWSAGLAIKNVVKNRYETALDNEIVIQPQYRLGVLYEKERWRATLDADLIENDPLGSLDRPTQFIGLGGEYDLTRALRIRGGLRTNLSDNSTVEDTITLGFGVSVFGATLDVSGMVGDNEYGLGLGLNFGL
ncbi:MAG: conjugal transfer protein TraF [Pseudomonadota bacterium]|nr:conjugal transfer protein TraF [Pseudomonadota bacterium]